MGDLPVLLTLPVISTFPSAIIVCYQFIFILYFSNKPQQQVY